MTDEPGRIRRGEIPPAEVYDNEDICPVCGGLKDITDDSGFRHPCIWCREKEVEEDYGRRDEFE